MPDEIADAIKKAYRELGGGFVAVRSSATAEDLPDASFAGQQSTFLNIRGEDAVIAAVQNCWASLFEPRAIFYRCENNYDHLDVGIAVPVQTMVQSEASGVLFTIEPLHNDKSKIFIEAIHGLGEYIVSGETTPDSYLVNKDDLKIIEKSISKQEWQLIKNSPSDLTDLNTNVRTRVQDSLQKIQKLSNEDIISLCEIGKKIEDLYQSPQDIEWAKQGSSLFVVQSRPITTLKEKEGLQATEIKEQPILTGVAASPGIAAGTVRVIPRATEIYKIKNGDVLVAEMTTPDFVPAMKKAVAIVTDRGGRTAHAAIVSRELGIPCVVGTDNATKILSDGREITVDGKKGHVYEGTCVDDKKASPAQIRKKIRTRTKVYVNLAEPELANTIAKRDVDGVGLLRAEFMIAQVGGHPRYLLHEGKNAQFVSSLTKNISMFTKAFHPRPVVYRTTDFKTNEYRHLHGGERYEDLEENPMIGYRGCSRYTQEFEVFRMEIEAIRNVCEKYDNLYVMIPFVRFIDEIKRLKEFIALEGLYSFPKFKLWMMVEVPSNIFLIDKFIDVGIDGISVGTNDLTQLILGIDRDSEKLADEFDEMNEAVLMAIERAVTVSASKGITSSVCGQAPSVYPELTEMLVKWGITSVSISPDMIDQTRDIIAAAERKIYRS
jgi:pyruvate,water dikinase